MHLRFVNAKSWRDRERRQGQGLAGKEGVIGCKVDVVKMLGKRFS